MNEDAMPSFQFSSIFPEWVINSQGIKEPFDLEDITRKLRIQTGLDEDLAQTISDQVIKKLLIVGKKEIESSKIRELVCAELAIRGLDKYKDLFDYDIQRFFLNTSFLEKYRGKQPAWGPLGYITYKRTYSRVKKDGAKEEFWETVQRVVEGCYSIQKTHCQSLEIPWNEEKAQDSAQKMYEKIWNFKFLPPGRGLWIMGTDFVRRHGSMSLNNCFAYETKIVTGEGIKKIGDCAGTEQVLLTKNGKWVSAPIRCFGKQKLMKLTLKRGENTKEIFCTPNHAWLLDYDSGKDEFKEVKTINLPVGCEIPVVQKSLQDDETYIMIDPSGNRTTIKNIVFMKEQPWKVVSVEETDREEDVYCATVDDYHCFTLEGGILTSNCGFVSTENLDLARSKPFRFMMDASMVGVGVGFDLKGAGKIVIKRPADGKYQFTVPDSREGWVDGLQRLLEAFFDGKQVPAFDYSLIRPKGTIIKGFGGHASGYEPLKEMYEDIEKLLHDRIGEPIKSTDIVDIMNLIGRCVVAGNVRRCIAKRAKIPTSYGYKNVENINIGDFVIASDGEFKKVTQIFDQGVQETIEINTSHGSIECTPNHRVAVYDGLRSYAWKQAGDLTTDDRLISIRHDGGIHNITEDQSWLIGYYHGDGHSNYLRKKELDGGGTVSLAMSTENFNDGLKDKVFSILTRMGYDPKVYTQENSTHINVYNVVLAKRMLKYKKPNEPPVIPDDVWNGTPEVRASYLAGLADSDGGKRNVLLNSTRLDFIKDVQKIALSLGIATTLNTRDPRYNEERDTTYRGCHVLSIRGIQSQKRAKELIEPRCAIWKCKVRKEKKNGLSLPYQILIDAKKNGEIDFQPLSSGLIRGNGDEKYRDANFDTLIEKGLVNPNWLPIEIEGIEPNGKEHTYDIEVEGDHEFVCEGFLVHNSAQIALGMPDDEDYVTMKDWTLHGDACTHHRWASNNSVIVDPGIGRDYTFIAEAIAKNGEPGIIWLDNARKYSRMNGVVDWKDKKVAGVNPCFSGETLIAVADGRGAIPIKELADAGLDVPVYSLNEDGMVEIKMGRHPRVTGHDKELLRITFEDGTSMKVTLDHGMILLNGTRVEAKDLQVGDNLPRFTRRTARMGDKKYLRVWKNTIERRKDKEFEHRIIARFNNEQRWNDLYEEGIKNGYAETGGIVVHHRDGNTFNNNPNNLEIKSFNDHYDDHGFFDVKGERNPMHGRTHSDETKELIGKTTRERCEDPDYKEILRQSIKEGMDIDEVREKISESRKRKLHEFYEQFERETDLETVWIDDRLFVKKNCDACGTKMILEIGRREQCYCSLSCGNKKKESIEARKEGQRAFFEDKQRNTLHKQINIFKDLKKELGRNPTTKEWMQECKARKVSSRLNNKSENPHVLRSFTDLKERASAYNHRVAKIERLESTENVYNITVDDNHTVGIILSHDPVSLKSDGIFTTQCGEQSLYSWELCVRGDTRIQTRHGCYEIQSIVNKVVEVWNGDKWSKTTVQMTSPESELLRVHFSDGSYLDTTKYHEFSALGKGKRIYQKKKASELEIGDKMPEWELGEIGCVAVDHAYEYGFFQGDGYVENKGGHVYPMICLYHNKIDIDIAGIRRRVQDSENYSKPYQRVSLKEFLDINKCTAMRKEDGFDDWVFEMDRESILQFVAGWIDSDGNIQKNPNTWNFRIFGTERNMRDLQLLLRRVGINHASVKKWKGIGEKVTIGGNETTRTKELWCCLIPSYESGGIPTKLKVIPPEMIGSRFKINNRYPDGKKIDAARKQKVTGIEYLGIKEPVYCFNEPEKHMGVFGNTLTYQCCLVETFPSLNDSLEEFLETLKYAYLYAKSVTLMRTHWKETNAVMLKNRRIGTSMSGIIDAFVRHGRRELLRWCDEGYKYLQDLDEEYSNWLCVPRSVKITTVKPSGCQVAGTLVNTSNGIFKLEEFGFTDGDQWQDVPEIATTSGKEITKFYINGLVDTKKFTTSDGNVLESSLVHRYKIHRGDPSNFDPSNIEWKSASEMEIGDYLITIIGDYDKQEEPFLNTITRMHFNNNPIKQPDKMTPKLAWLIGFIYGDGYIGEKGVKITFNRQYSSLVNGIKNVVKDLFDIDVTISGNEIEINSTILLSYLESNGIDKGYAHEIEIPEVIRKSSKESILSFINGFWRADGGIHHESTISICTVSERFARQLLAIGRAVGLNMRIKNAGMGGWGLKDRWIMTTRFTDDKNLRYLPKKLKSRRHFRDGKEYWLDPVENIENSRSETFDISVPDGNAYNANGVISHNTTSLLPGVSAGIHYPHSEYYIRRIRIAKDSELISMLEKAGYPMEESITDRTTMVVDFPVHEKSFQRGKRDVSMEMQVMNAIDLQRYWSDNQVSITVSFNKNEAARIKDILEMSEDKLKGISFLPLSDHGYQQAPYESISKEQYEEMVSKIKPMNLDSYTESASGVRGCDGDKCVL